MADPQMDFKSENERLQRIKKFDQNELGIFITEFRQTFRKFLKDKDPMPKDKSIELAHAVVVIIHFKENLNLTSTLMTYAVSTAKNLYNNELQKKINHRTDSYPNDFFNNIASEENIFEQVEESEIKLAVNRCLQKLSEKCRKILRNFMNDVPPIDSARMMGYSSKEIYQVRKSECMKHFELEVRRCSELKELKFDDE